MKFENSVVIFTGKASGFGVYIVKVLLLYGARVAIIDLNARKLNRSVEEIDPE